MRGRTSAPHVSTWAPLAGKVALAVFAAVVLAVIGVKAGPHAEPAPPAADPAPVTVSSALPQAVRHDDPPPTMVDDGGIEAKSGILPDGRVILNVASQEELEKLPSIGPSRARAILALRQRLAKFRSVEDLLRVRGIGRKTLRRIKAAAVLDRPSVPDAGRSAL